MFLCSLYVFWFYFASTEAQTLELFVPASPVYVEIGNVLILNISYKYSGTGNDEITWHKKGAADLLVKRKDDGRISESDKRATIINDGDLVLSNVSLADNVTYEVHLEVGVKRQAGAIEVIVLEQPSAISECSSNSPIVLNETSSITCLCNSIGGNPPPTASWLKNGGPFRGKGYLKKYLTLTDVSKNDAGNYTCKVESHTLTDEKHVMVVVNYKPIITSFKSNSSADYVLPNSAVVFTCKVDAVPTANVKILHNGNPVTGVNGDGIYIISSVNSGHSGRYQCVAENLLGTTMSHNITLKVAEKPKAIIQCTEEKPITVNEGDPVSCVCNSTGGVPTPKAWWIKDGATVSGPTNVSNILNKKMIRNDKGTYTCKVESIPSLSDQTSIQISIYYAPSITFFNKNTTVKAGTSVIIFCKADGSPQRTYTLYKDEETVLTTSDLVLVYTIDKVNASDKGEYKCMAKNTLGSESKTFYLTVSEIAPKTTMPPTRDPDNICGSDGGTKWYITVITLLSGILIGLAIALITIKFRHRISQPQNKPNPDYDDVIPSQSQTTGNPSVYQELNLKDMNKGDNYQALNKNVRSTGKRNEALEEKEGAYQELSGARGRNDDNYQSLQKV